MALSGRKNHNLFLFLLISFCCAACNQTTRPEVKDENAPVVKSSSTAPDFNADSAYAYVKKQVDFGPRVPATKAHFQCADYLIAELKKLSDTVIVQKANIKVFDGKAFQIRNIMGMFNPELKERILLCAHWDTRPWADQDVERQKEPIQGANDGASGVGVLLEIARQLHTARPDIGIDILFLDLEDYGQPSDSKFPHKEDTYALGTQYWAKNIPIPDYHPKYGILLDMVGAPQATFGKEEYSRQYAPSVVNKVWATAARIGYGNYFINKETGAITDDHYYINEIAGIPTIDIIHHDPLTRTGFGSYWHTHNDTMEAIDKKTLKAVGQTLLEVIFENRKAS